MPGHAFKTLEDRRKIERLWEAGHTQQEIAAAMGTAQSVISNELARGRDGTRLPNQRLRYSAELAQLRMQESLERRGRSTALRAQQIPGKLDRSRWEGCGVCNGCGVGGSNELLCSGEEAKYCPFCGCPLTEEAWAELERRINGGTTDN